MSKITLPEGFQETISEAELRVALFDFIQEADYKTVKRVWDNMVETNPKIALQAALKVKALKKAPPKKRKISQL